ncbi:cell adhesion molecule 4-like [Cyclopterus lumpus]|uniref:cell adhesion molecule 4-like n=1 Tax=Cyclopterus lumpus TaxID=8103 RepID=UPI00148759CC|nr:cell adhesion molecule 4-like [Cyclopterus lumpus]
MEKLQFFTRINMHNGALASLIGGVLGSVLLLVCIAVVMLWAFHRRKGSYVTNETDGDDEDESEEEDEALRTLRMKEDD